MLKRKLLVIFLALVFCVWIFLNLNYQIPVLMYHSIDGDCNICVSKKRFYQQMEFLNRFKYKVISPDELVDLINKKSKQKKLVVITFDDGYENNYTKAFPILKKYNFPATIFVIVNKIGQKNYLNGEQLKDLTKNNITIGNHTLSHEYLPNLTGMELVSEILESKCMLENVIEREVDFISYPIGGFNLKVQELVKDANYRAAFTTNRKIKKFDLYALRRIKVTDKDSLFKFWMKVSGFYHLFKRTRPPQ